MNRITWAIVTILIAGTAFAQVDMMGNGDDGAGRAGGGLSAAARDEMLAASSVTLVTSIPSPCGGNDGLAWDGTYLWISDYNTRRAYQVDPETGAAIRSIPVPGTYPNGLAWDGSALWYVDSNGDTIYKLDPSDGTVLGSIPSPGHRPGGLEFDGTDLWCSVTGSDMASGGPDKIYRITTDGVVVATFDAIGPFPTGLAFDGQFLWHADNVNNTIYKLNPTDLSIVDTFPAPGDYPNDLAWDGQYLWVVDNGTDRLYKYDVGTPSGQTGKPSVLFEDTFPSTTLDVAKWPGGAGASVDGVGMNEPSAPYSLRLNGHPSGGDSVESRVIDLSSRSGAVLTYYYEETGGGESPDETEDLIVEYYDGANWVELDRQPGSGPDMTAFVKRTVTLPASALHAGFRLRIRSIGTAGRSTYDDWFVDNVKIQAAAPGTPGTAVTINFDDVNAPCSFSETSHLTDEYAALGVTFEGRGGNDGGAILNECGGFSVDGHSTPNFLAFNVGARTRDGGTARGPETLVFSPPVASVTVSVAHGSGTLGELSIEAFDVLGAPLDAATVTLSNHLTPISVSAPGIVRVVVSSTAHAFVLDDLTFSQEALPTVSQQSVAAAQAGRQEDAGQGSRMINGQLVPRADEP